MAAYVYILANRRHGTLCIDETNDLVRRVHEHKEGNVAGFTRRYGVSSLVYFEAFNRIEEAIQRETRLKKRKRDWKIALIEEHNPDWRDLYAGIAS